MITFKSHSKTDIPYRVKWLNNQQANKFAVENPSHKTNISEQTKWFEDYKKNEAKKFFTILEDEKPVGFMGLSKINQTKKSANLFVLIGEDCARGRGIGAQSVKYLINYGFGMLTLNIIELEVNKRNTTAIKLYCKLGFIKLDENNEEIKMVLKRRVATPA